VWLATNLFVQHRIPWLSLRALDTLLPRLAAVRAPLAESPPLVFIAYNAEPSVLERLARVPEAAVVAAPNEPPYYLPGDGHPSPEGNAVWSRLVWAEVARLPVVQRFAATVPGAKL
jgi:hypothetical protein